MNNTCWTAEIITDCGDNYLWVFDYEPTMREVIERLHEYEGETESLDWYLGSTWVSIKKTIIITERYHENDD